MTAARSLTTAFLIALALVAGCGPRGSDGRTPHSDSASAPSPNAAAGPGVGARLVSGDRVGPLRIGLSMDSVRSAYTIVRDTLVQPDPSRPAERLVSVLVGRDTAVLSVGNNRVTQVVFTAPGFATVDSLGVGTPLRRLIGLPKVEGYLHEGRLFVMSPSKCGLAFGITQGLGALPSGKRDSAGLSALPQSLIVDRVRIDACMPDDEPFAEDDSTFDVQTDTMFVARDLDGNGRTDYALLENRPWRRRSFTYSYRLAVYLDSLPASRHATWATGWDEEFGSEQRVDEVHALGSHAALLFTSSAEADYTSETVLLVRDGKVTVELTHGEDYGNGFFEPLTESGRPVVDASQMHLELRGKPVTPALECGTGEWPAVRTPFDTTSWRFVAERPRCVKARY